MEQIEKDVSKEILDSILSDLEKEKIVQFVEDETMREAVKKIILAGIYYNGTLRKGEKANPTVNFLLAFVNNRENSLSNEEAGAELKAAWAGVKAMELAFKNLEKFTRENQLTKSRPKPISPR